MHIAIPISYRLAQKEKGKHSFGTFEFSFLIKSVDFRRFMHKVSCFSRWIFTGGCAHDDIDEEDHCEAQGQPGLVQRQRSNDHELSTDVWPAGGGMSSPGPAAQSWMPTSRIDYACEWADRELLYLQRGGLSVDE